MNLINIILKSIRKENKPQKKLNFNPRLEQEAAVNGKSTTDGWRHKLKIFHNWRKESIDQNALLQINPKHHENINYYPLLLQQSSDQFCDIMKRRQIINHIIEFKKN